MTGTTPNRAVIYDLGAYNGDDIAYYLKKADLVVAVEANPVLCQRIRNRFHAEIASGRVVLESCVLTAEDREGEVRFHIHKSNPVLSTFCDPGPSGEYESVLLPSISVPTLIARYGAPYYIKIDIENYDEAILRALFENGIRPPYISAESHSAEIFALLVVMGRYRSFKLVDGRSVPEKYRNHAIAVGGRIEFHSFPFHSAGPFGNDIEGPWMTTDNFFRLLAFEGLGWKDIHATNVFGPDPGATPRLASHAARAVRGAMADIARKCTPQLLRGAVERCIFLLRSTWLGR